MKAVSQLSALAPRCASRASAPRDRTGEGEFEQALGAAASGAPAARQEPHESAAPRGAEPGEGGAEANAEAHVETGAGRGDSHAPDARPVHEQPPAALVVELRNAAAVAEPGAQNVPALPPAAVPRVAADELVAVTHPSPNAPVSSSGSPRAGQASAVPPLPEAAGLRVRVLASRVATAAPAGRGARLASAVPATPGRRPDTATATPGAGPDAVAATRPALSAPAPSVAPATIGPTSAAPVDRFGIVAAAAAPVPAIAAPGTETATTPAASAPALAVDEIASAPTGDAPGGLPPASESPGRRASIDLDEAADAPVAGGTSKPIARRPHAAPVQGRLASKPSATEARGIDHIHPKPERAQREGPGTAMAQEREGAPTRGLAAPEPGGTAEVPAAAAASARSAERTATPAPREAGAQPAASTIDDARFQPMRRAADQVTLQFQGEGGLEGRLRITVRGDAVQATVLSAHEGTLERLGSETGSLRRALNEQGFTNARIAVHDLRDGGAAGSADARAGARDHDERRQGEPQRRPGQGRDSRQGADSDAERRTTRDERRSA